MIQHLTAIEVRVLFSGYTDDAVNSLPDDCSKAFAGSDFNAAAEYYVEAIKYFTAAKNYDPSFKGVVVDIYMWAQISHAPYRTLLGRCLLDDGIRDGLQELSEGEV